VQASAGGQREVYVYYRVAGADAAALAGRVRALQVDLCARHPGLHARLLRRPVAPGDVQTWMEVYAMPGGVSEDLQRAIEAAAASLLPSLQGPRHCEVFEGMA
jgi:hypothetical protein